MNIDSFVQNGIASTCGNLYRPSIGRLSRYPIPPFPLTGPGDLLDIGCGWGRWTIAATRAGFTATGIDPDPDAVAAAERVARDLGSSARFQTAASDALPFADQTFDVVFSFSVVQHLNTEQVEKAFLEVRRVLRPGGVALIEMPNGAGILNRIRALQVNPPAPMRYYPLKRLRELGETIGPTTILPDAFLSLNAQPSDLDLLTPAGRAIVLTSTLLKRATAFAPALTSIADSVYVKAQRTGDSPC